MSAQIKTGSHTATRVGGWSLIAAATGFMAVFAFLAARFNYPDVLDGAAGDVLPTLLSLGDAGRAVWAVYALLPLLLIPASVGAAAMLREAAPNAMRAAVAFGTIAAVSMLLGLARWPTVHWELARAYAAAAPDMRVAVGAVFSGLNLYLGNFVGEFLGELALNAFFVLSGIGLLLSGRRGLGYAGITVAVIGAVAGLRNVTSLVATIAEVNNYILPVWLITLGVVMLRQRTLTATADCQRLTANG